MSTPAARKARTVKYRCTGCGARRTGSASLVSCPDCGAALVVLYGPATLHAQRAKGNRGR